MQYSQKPTHFQFFRKNVFGWCQRKHLQCTISRRPRTAFSKHWQSKYLYISAYLCKEIFVRRRKLLSVGRLNNFCKAARYQGFVKSFEVFGNLTIFQDFDTSSIALKPWNLPDNLDFKGKIVAKFLIKSQYIINITIKQQINHRTI